MTLVPRLAILTFVVSSGCADGDDECTQHPTQPRPRASLVLSAAAVDFGTLARGSRVEATVYVEHTGVDPDTGEAVTQDVGIGRLGAFHEAPMYVAGSDTDGFGVTWSLDEAECPAGAAVSTQWLLTDRWYDYGWMPPDSGPPEPEGGEIVRIGPGCRLPLHLSFTASSAGFHAAGLVVETVAAPGIEGRAPAVRAKVERVQQVLLSAEVLGTSTGENPVIAGVVQASPDECRPGESVELSVWASDPNSEITYYWGDDQSTDSFDDPMSATPAWTCPEVEPGTGRNYIIYVLVTDDSGHQAWMYSIVTAWGERVTRCDERDLGTDLLWEQVGVEL